MLRKFVTAGLGALGLALQVASGQVMVKERPPRAVSERRPPRPGSDFVWVGGYQRWDGRRYVWMPGKWERPPSRGARWVPPKWDHRGGGWMFVDGRWR